MLLQLRVNQRSSSQELNFLPTEACYYDRCLLREFEVSAGEQGLP